MQGLLVAWQEAYEAGRHVSAAELCRDCPELPPELERQLNTLRRMNVLAAPEPAAADTPTSCSTRGQATGSHEPLPGQVGGYRVLGLLGEGGMGRVLRAEDPGLGRLVALKVMRGDLARDERARQRFLREARAATALQHDNVVAVYQVGEEGGVPFLAMPLLAGETLEARLEREGRLPVAEVLRVGREAAEGLAAAHAAGLVHRDVKPANLWLEAPSGRVKVLDFGLVRPQAGGDGVTQPGALLGTPAYMSPEQIDGGAVDARSDLFSLGCVLYRAATGKAAFEAATLTALLRAVAEHDPPAPHEVRAELPRGLSELILRLLCKSPAGRPADAREVSNTLAAVGPASVGLPVTTEWSGGRDPTRPRRRLLVGVAGVVAVTFALVVVAVVVATQASRWVGRPDPGREQVPEGGGRAAAAAPLKVLRLDVMHYARKGEFEDPADRLGVRGGSFETRLDDSVTVAAKLSGPAYCYLIAYRPDGTEDLCFPEDAARPPTATKEPKFPLKDGGDHYGLEEGEGLMAFALVVSSRPLPAYAEWKRGRGDSPWRRTRAAPGVVWHGDGESLRFATASDPEALGKRPEATGTEPFAELLRWLRRGGEFEAVEGVAFAVLPRR
jgi:hypothetical protein